MPLFRLSLSALPVLTLAAVSFACGGAGGPVERSAAVAPANTPTPDLRPGEESKWSDATVPAGTEIVTSLIDRLSSESSRPDAIFSVRLARAVTAGAVDVLPANSIIEGIIKEVTAASAGGDQGGSLSVGMRIIRTPIGTGSTLVARVGGAGPDSGAGMIKVEPGRTRAESAVLSAGKAGKPLTLESGSSMTLVLQEPLTIKVNQ